MTSLLRYQDFLNLRILIEFPGSPVVRIPRSHRGGRGSIPRLGGSFFVVFPSFFEAGLLLLVFLYLSNDILHD